MVHEEEVPLSGQGSPPLCWEEAGKHACQEWETEGSSVSTALSLCNQMQPRTGRLQGKMSQADSFTGPRTRVGSWQGGRREICISLCQILCPNKVGTASLGAKGLLRSWVWKKSHPSRYPCSSRSLLSVGQMVVGAVGCSMSVPPCTAAPCKPAFLLSHAVKIKMGPKCAEFMGVI